MILITSEYDSGNKFMLEMVTSVRKYAIRYQIYCNPKSFWSPSVNFSLVHIHWIEELFEDWEITDPKQLEALEETLILWKRHSKILLTFHNHQPHSGDELMLKAYEIVHKYCDGVHHLGKFSADYAKNLFDEKVKLAIIPHINYAYRARYSKTVARSYFGFEEEDLVILVFGAVRNRDEKNRILGLQKAMQKNEAKWIIPRWLSEGNTMQKVIERLQFKFNDSLQIDNAWIKETQVSYYFEAADIVLIPRGEIMNSGNLILAYNFGKVAVGPDFGNVGAYLKKLGNPTYQVNDPQSEIAAMEQAISLLNTDLGRKNQDYSMEHWNRNKVGYLMNKFYEDLLGLLLA